jgi:hypothetical protein
MRKDPKSQLAKSEVWVGRCLALLILILVFVFLVFHQPKSTLNPDDPKALQFQHMESRESAAANVREALSLILTVTFGLAAMVGFSLSGGFGSGPHRQAVMPILTSIFIYFVTRTLVYSYDAYTAMAIQFEAGFFFVTRVEELVLPAARSLSCSAALAFLVFAVYATDKRQEISRCA